MNIAKEWAKNLYAYKYSATLLYTAIAKVLEYLARATAYKNGNVCDYMPFWMDIHMWVRATCSIHVYNKEMLMYFERMNDVWCNSNFVLVRSLSLYRFPCFSAGFDSFLHSCLQSNWESWSCAAHALHIEMK